MLRPQEESRPALNTSFRFGELALEPAHDGHGLVGRSPVGDDHLELLAREVLRQEQRAACARWTAASFRTGTMTEMDGMV